MAITKEQQDQFDEIYAKNPNSPYVKDLQSKYGYTPSTNTNPPRDSNPPTNTNPPRNSNPPTNTNPPRDSNPTTDSEMSPTYTPQGDVKMWTGSGYITVNPKYVQRYLDKGYTYALPSEESINETLKKPLTQDQMLDPVTNKVVPRPPTPEQSLGIEPEVPQVEDTYQPRYLDVTSDGTAPENARIGDIIVTAGGNYEIIGGTPGNWESRLVGTRTDMDVATENGFDLPSYEDGDSMLESIYETQLEQSINAIMQSYNSGIKEIEREQQKVAEHFARQQRLIDVEAVKSAKRFSDYIAVRGLTTSGASAQAQIALSIQEQQAKSEALTSEQMAYQELSNARLDLETQKNNAIENAKLQTLSDYNQAQYKEMKTQEEQDFQTELQTINRYSNDYQAEINKRKAEDPNDPLIPYLESARIEKIAFQQEQANNAINAQMAAYNAGMEEEYDRAWDRFLKIGYVVSEADSQTLGLPVGLTTAEYQKILDSKSEPPANTRTLASVKTAIDNLVLQEFPPSEYTTEGGNIVLGKTPEQENEEKLFIAEQIARRLQIGEITPQMANSLFIDYGLDISYYGGSSGLYNEEEWLNEKDDIRNK